MNPKAIAVIIGSSVTVLILAVFFLTKNSNVKPGKYDDFAKCLAQKDVTMYGAYWCPHCQSQKKLFGTSFDFVPYVECTVQTKLCVEKNVTGYPTWIMGETRLEGEQSLQKLSEISSCTLPN